MAERLLRWVPRAMLAHSSIITHHGAALTRSMSKSQACPLMLACAAASSAGMPCTRRCCTFDNRGIGCSSIPEQFSAYRTGIMAADVRALMDHLGWARAHVMGMSLGGEQCNALCGYLFARPQRPLSVRRESVTTKIRSASLVLLAYQVAKIGQLRKGYRMGLLKHAAYCQPHNQPEGYVAIIVCHQ